jgi:polyisoprenoid-binding protein YceI
VAIAPARAAGAEEVSAQNEQRPSQNEMVTVAVERRSAHFASGSALALSPPVVLQTALRLEEKTMIRNLVIATALVATPALAHATEWTVDPAHSSAEFKVKHLMVSTVRGQFGKLSGSASWDKPDYSDAKVDVSIDAGSIDTGEPKRDAHLKSPDFFDAAKFPTLTFKSKRVEKSREKGHLNLVGDLTIHGVTKEVTFDVTAPSPEIKTPWGGIASGAEATAKINRKDFGLNWNKALDGGGVVVSDEVKIDINLELAKKAPLKAEAAPAKK